MNVYERSSTTNNVNFVPFIFDLVLSNEGVESHEFFSSFYSSRWEKWFVIITLTDLKGQDALAPEHAKRKANLLYLRNLPKEYLNTATYIAAYFD